LLIIVRPTCSNASVNPSLDLFADEADAALAKFNCYREDALGAEAFTMVLLIEVMAQTAFIETKRGWSVDVVGDI
jgi:hypothetical protein